jgi:hypothetical protein
MKRVRKRLIEREMRSRQSGSGPLNARDHCWVSDTADSKRRLSGRGQDSS